MAYINGKKISFSPKIVKIQGGDNSEIYNQGFEDGKKSVAQLEKYASAIQFKSLNLFGKEEVTLNLDNATTLNNLCRSSQDELDNTTVKHLTINCLLPITNITNMILAAERDDVLEQITFNADISKVTSMTYSFARLRALKIIDGTPLDFSSATSISSTTFTGCSVLEEIRFIPNSIFVDFPFSQSAVLSDESIQSVINGLADLTEKESQTLTLHKTIGEKITDKQKADISSKNWLLDY